VELVAHLNFLAVDCFELAFPFEQVELIELLHFFFV
jgi:hypothetical protein